MTSLPPPSGPKSSKSSGLGPSPLGTASLGSFPGKTVVVSGESLPISRDLAKELSGIARAWFTREKERKIASAICREHPESKFARQFRAYERITVDRQNAQLALDTLRALVKDSHDQEVFETASNRNLHSSLTVLPSFGAASDGLTITNDRLIDTAFHALRALSSARDKRLSDDLRKDGADAFTANLLDMTWDKFGNTFDQFSSKVSDLLKVINEEAEALAAQLPEIINGYTRAEQGLRTKVGPELAQLLSQVK